MSFFAQLIAIGAETAQAAIDNTGVLAGQRKVTDCTPCAAQARMDAVKAHVAEVTGVAPRRPKPGSVATTRKTTSVVKAKTKKPRAAIAPRKPKSAAAPATTPVAR